MLIRGEDCSCISFCDSIIVIEIGDKILDDSASTITLLDGLPLVSLGEL